MTGQVLLAWLKLLALDGDLARAEPSVDDHEIPAGNAVAIT
jgi:hypothetical protein